jgi:hypothetical protein
MKFKLYKEHGALNSTPIFHAFEQGLKSLGFVTTDSHDAIPVIWSALWQGRMLPNRSVYRAAIMQQRPIIILEVGNLIRGITWRVSLNHINGLGVFGNNTNLDHKRHKKLNLNLLPINNNRPSSILIAAQHQQSLQWEGQPTMTYWATKTIDEIRKYTDRPILVRPHPRSPFSLSYTDVKIIAPKKIANSYDNFDIDYNMHCVVNHNSGPGVQSAMQGTPVIVDKSSIASPISDIISNIEKIQLPDRTEWFTQLCHTEWTQEEIATGIPLKRLIPEIESRLS